MKTFVFLSVRGEPVEPLKRLFECPVGDHYGIDIGMTSRYAECMKIAISAVASLRKYFIKRKSAKLFSALNDTYALTESPEEYAVRKKSRKCYAKTIRKERW